MPEQASDQRRIPAAASQVHRGGVVEQDEGQRQFGEADERVGLEREVEQVQAGAADQQAGGREGQGGAHGQAFQAGGDQAIGHHHHREHRQSPSWRTVAHRTPRIGACAARLGRVTDRHHHRLRR